jgi:hypothetical protein
MNLKKSIDTVERAVIDGVILEEQINKSALKVLKMKERLGLHQDRLIKTDYTYREIGKAENFKVPSMQA